jgi:PleD family two-component response regulator
VSVGVATLTPDTGSTAALVQEADQTLYRSKHVGRNRVSHNSQRVSLASTTRTPAPA